MEKSSFARCYDSCPLLLWTILAVASKSVEQHSYLHLLLVDPIRRLAFEATQSGSQSVTLVQALILLCCWPLPHTLHATDPSWLYSGMAIHIATQLGLHRPHHHAEFMILANPDFSDTLARKNTWLACFIINQLYVCYLHLATKL
jgi:hypothetical protein